MTTTSDPYPQIGSEPVQASATLEINDQVQKLWAAGRNVYHLGFGESRFPTHPLLAEELKRHTQKRSYLPSAGLPVLRETIASYYYTKYNLSVSPDQVFVGIGSKSLLYAALKVQRGSVILPVPSWVSYSSQAHLTGHTLIPLALDHRSQYSLSDKLLEACLEQDASTHDRGSILILTSPNNPTGTVFDQASLKALASVAREHKLIVLSDEIYSRINHTGTPHHSIAQYYPEGTLIFGGISKHLSLGGWRMGVVIFPSGPLGEMLANRFQALAGAVWSCVPAPFQYTAIKAYENNPEIEHYIETCALIHKIRTVYFHNHLTGMGVDCPTPQGAFYLYPDFNRFRPALERLGIFTSDELARHLLQHYELATLPGTAFHENPSQLTLRLSTSYLDMETDEQAEHIVTAFQSDQDSEAFIENHHPRLKGALKQLATFIQELKEFNRNA